jgi:hypothetical protein
MSSLVAGSPAARPRAVTVDFVDDCLQVGLADGRVVRVPLDWFPKLVAAKPAELADWRLVGEGIGISWPQLDEDLSVAGLLGNRET